MTETKTTRRRRRASDESTIPADVRAWFAGGGPDGQPIPWAVLLEPTELVRQWWAEWLAEHPSATVSKGARYLLGVAP